MIAALKWVCMAVVFLLLGWGVAVFVGSALALGGWPQVEWAAAIGIGIGLVLAFANWMRTVRITLAEIRDRLPPPSPAAER